MPDASVPDASAPDEASPGLRIEFVGHATTLLDFGPTRVLTDPFLRPRLGPLQRHGQLPDPATLRADVVVISHGHPDHFDPASLDALPGNPVLVVPRGLGGSARRVSRPSGVVEIEAGEVVEVAGARIRAVPARHWIAPGAPRARPLGYVIQAASVRGQRAYFAGDTGRYASMADAVANVDVALLPVWTWGPHLGPGHLGPRSAAMVTAELEPRAVVPIHWGTLYPRHLHRMWQRPLVNPGDRFAAHVAFLAPQVQVCVLRPGERTSIA